MAEEKKKKPYEIRKEKFKKKQEERRKKSKEYWEKRYGSGSKGKKKYSSLSDGKLARAKKVMTSDKAYGTKTFKSAFADARKDGKGKFTWQGKSYHTKTKSELEGAKEKERFARAQGSKLSAPKKGNIFSKMATKMRGGHSTQKGYEEARDKRRKEKRIAAIEKRKDEGKSYSAKNLASLKGDTGAKKTWITKREKKDKNLTRSSPYSISS